jgi:hypothetical protein
LLKAFGQISVIIGGLPGISGFPSNFRSAKMKTQIRHAVGLALVAAAAIAGPAGAADGDVSFNAMLEQFQRRTGEYEQWRNAMMPSGTGIATQSADDVMTAMLRGYTREALDHGHWLNAFVGDAPGYAVGNPLLAVAPGAGTTGFTEAGMQLAAQSANPLRSFNAYLAYLGQRMRVDAGPPGPLLRNDTGTDPFDRYLEEINFRIQTLYRADQLGQ